MAEFSLVSKQNDGCRAGQTGSGNGLRRCGQVPGVRGRRFAARPPCPACKAWRRAVARLFRYNALDALGIALQTAFHKQTTGGNLLFDLQEIAV